MKNALEGAVRNAIVAAGVLGVALVGPASAGEIDRTIADFKTPAEIKWVRNAAGTNEQAVLFGDPAEKK